MFTLRQSGKSSECVCRSDIAIQEVNTPFNNVNYPDIKRWHCISTTHIYYKSKSFKKTVYDPSKINTDTYIKWGLQAANNAASSSPSGKHGREWTGTDNQGVKWHGYCNDKGEVTSFYPED